MQKNGQPYKARETYKQNPLYRNTDQEDNISQGSQQSVRKTYRYHENDAAQTKNQKPVENFIKETVSDEDFNIILGGDTDDILNSKRHENV